MSQELEFIIYRLRYDTEATPSEFRTKEGKKLFSTLERPDKKNQKDNPKTKENESSCIPEGRYWCAPYSSEKYPNTWEITGVKNRSAILFHSANCADDLLGCIGVGEKLLNNISHPITKKLYKYWLLGSRNAMAEFKKIMPKEGFWLNITSKRTEETCRL